MKNKYLPTGATIALIRSFRLPWHPSAEAGPAAVIMHMRKQERGCEGCYSAVVAVASWISAGKCDWSWDYRVAQTVGQHYRTSRSVSIVAPIRPPQAGFDYLRDRLNFDGEAIWQDSENWTPRDCDDDVTLVWLPTKIFPRQTIAESAGKLVTEAFGSGGIYTRESLSEIYDRESARRRAEKERQK